MPRVKRGMGARMDVMGPKVGQKSLKVVLWDLQGRDMEVTMGKGEAGEECPLTLEEIGKDALEWLPDAVFMQSKPDLRKMTMPCGHAFGAMNLMYHFARRNMICPCCRKGNDERVAPFSIPPHFRVDMIMKVADQIRLDRREEDDDNLAVAMLIQQEETARGGIVSPVTNLNRVHDLNLALTLHGEEDEEMPYVLTLQFPLVLVVDSAGAPVGMSDNKVQFQLRSMDQHALARILREDLDKKSRIDLAITGLGSFDQLVVLDRHEGVSLELGGAAGLGETEPVIQVIVRDWTWFEIQRDTRSGSMVSITWIASLDGLTRTVSQV